MTNKQFQAVIDNKLDSIEESIRAIGFEPFSKSEYGLLYCGDCLEVMKGIPDKAVDVVLTDIPYNISQISNGLRNLNYGEWDYQTGKEEQWINAIVRMLSGVVIVFCHKKQFSKIEQILDDSGYSTRTLIWKKPNPTVLNCDKLYIEATELAVYAKKPGGFYAPKYKHNVFEYPSPVERVHPTQKPVQLFSSLVIDCSQQDSIVLDPFAGSGTTLVAAKQLGRKYVGIEISPDYCKIAEDRLRQQELFAGDKNRRL
jgi:DNA modification methylase